MKELNYTDAIELFKEVLAKKDDPEAKINLAECYRKVNDTENAEFLFAQVVRLTEAQPIHFLYYGEMLQRNGKCDLAKEWFQKFAEAVPEDNRGQLQSRACDYEQELKTRGEGIYDVKKVAFNSPTADFGTAYYKDGIVFASERDKGAVVKRNHSWTGAPFLDLYFVSVKGAGADMTTGRPEKFDNSVNSKYHDAIVSFNKDQSEMFFTRNNLMGSKSGADDDGIVRLKIFSAKKKGNGWSNEMALPFNSDEYSCAHPSLSADGSKLYFASDMPGGFGGMDLYVSELENGRWGPPLNLGPNINTEGNELFPTVHSTGRLYFSSDGQIGLGGLDIYYVDAKGGGQWTSPENLGAPINSNADDFGFALKDDGTSGFFSSDRTGGSGRDDIYSFAKLAVPVKVFVYDALTKEPLDTASVSLDCSKRSFKTGKDGRVTVDVKFNSCCNFTAEVAGYEKGTQQGCVKDASSTEEVIIEVPLRKIRKYDLRVFVFDQREGLPLPNAVVTLLACDSTKNKTAITDGTGEVNMPLEAGCRYRIKAEKDKYFTVITPDTINTVDLPESKTYVVQINLQPTTSNPNNNPNNFPLVDNNGKPVTDKNKGKKDPKVVYQDPESGLFVKNGKPFTGKYNGETFKDGVLQSNPRSNVYVPSTTKYPNDSSVAYFLHIYYDFDQSFLRDESEPELQKLFKTMQDNPSFVIEISSHTDARGSNSYNKRLSQRRAESVVRWLVEKGIDRNRLVARGYGETMSTNKCVNYIPCTEKEHQMNRRTEFRVLNCKDCREGLKISAPNDNAKVDKCVGCPF